MRPHKLLHALDWPTLVSSICHLLSGACQPLLTKLVLHHIRFTYPATITLIHVATTAICLWFWTIFGLYKVRTLSLRTTLTLASATSLTALLHIFTLASTSIPTFQAARMLPTALVLTFRQVKSGRNHPFLPCTAVIIGTAILALHDIALSPSACLTALFYVLVATASNLLTHSLATSVTASELQLHLLTKSLSAVLLIPTLPLLDDYTVSPGSIRNFAFDETSTILVFSTGLLSFFTFVSVRASANRLSAELYNCLVFITALSVFASHFAVFEHRLRPGELFGAACVVGGCFVLAERRRQCSEDQDGGERVVAMDNIHAAV